MTPNPLVEFLASYGPQASSNNLYDEFVVNAAQKTGCEPLEIEQPLIGQVIKWLQEPSPKSIILTGTAGDGKTYTARRVMEGMVDSGKTWGSTEKIFEVSYSPAFQHTVRFIKDLSELKESEKDDVFNDICNTLAGKGRYIYIICVNDGHLLKFFRDRGERGRVLHQRIASMLRNDQQLDDDLHFRLINMSRQSHRDLFERIVEAIVSHSDWEKCEGCPILTSQEQPCPIRKNRDVLLQKDPASMRARLKDMIRIAAADGEHLSVRQLILLTVNILLGDQKPGKELLTCHKAKNRASRNEYNVTNPYANVFGENLGERQRKQYGAFSVLGEFGVGHETNNFFDHSLLWKSSWLPVDDIYGDRIFAVYLKDYRENPSENAYLFRRAMLEQRRRLFFSLDSDVSNVRDEPRQNPWNLSVFKYGATYIELANQAINTKPIPLSIVKPLIRGLNRMMVGEMTIADDRLWLTEPSGVYLGQAVPLLISHAGRKVDGTTYISFPTIEEDGKAPILRLTPLQREDLAVDLHLRPTLVECILRIAYGALPASFSSECRRDIERFQLKVATSMNQASGEHKPQPQEISMIAGRLQNHPITALTEEEGW